MSTTRRRFFPARPTTQTAPGQRVALSMQLRKEGEVTELAPPATLAPIAPALTWISPHAAIAAQELRTGDTELVLWQDGGATIADLFGIPTTESRWSGEPRFKRGGLGLPINADGWLCHAISCQVAIPDDIRDDTPPVVFSGGLFGVPEERVSWQLSWGFENSDPNDAFIDPGDVSWADSVSQKAQHPVIVSGAVLQVAPIWQGGGIMYDDFTETLTATALIDGEPYGALTFIATYQAW